MTLKIRNNAKSHAGYSPLYLAVKWIITHFLYNLQLTMLLITHIHSVLWSNHSLNGEFTLGKSLPKVNIFPSVWICFYNKNRKLKTVYTREIKFYACLSDWWQHNIKKKNFKNKPSHISLCFMIACRIHYPQHHG